MNDAPRDPLTGEYPAHKPWVWNCEVCGRFRSSWRSRRTGAMHGSSGHESCDRTLAQAESGLSELHGVMP